MPNAGEDASTLIEIPSLPFYDAGNTCSFLNDHEPPCGAAGGPDVVYQYTATEDGFFYVSLCGSSYDTEVYIAEDSPSSIIACNDDYCGFQSEIDHVPIAAGHIYYIFVDGYAGDCGDYSLQMGEDNPPPPPSACNEPYVWEIRAPFFDPRTSQSGIEGGSASIIDGKIYVSHGFRYTDTSLLSIYDIASDTWTHGGPLAPDASVPRSEMGGGTACGKHYAIGGRPALAAVEEFTPGFKTAGTWALRSPLSVARGGLGCASSGDHIYAIGGRNGATFGSGTIYGTNEVYDCSNDTWTTLAPLPVPVSDNYATLAHQGKVYVFGGAADPELVLQDTQIFDIATGTWSMGARMPTARAAAMAGVLCDGKIAVIGGYDPYAGNLTVTEIYDPDTDTWAAGPEFFWPLSEITQGQVWDDSGIYAIGSGIFGVSGPFVLRLRCCNLPPVARCTDVTVTSGAGCAAAASIDNGSSDPDADDVISLAQEPPGPYALGATPVTLTVTDAQGASSRCTATVTVIDPAPVAGITGPASGGVFAVNTPVSFTGTWTDTNGGPHTAQWTFDGVPDASFAAGSGTSGTANTTHTFSAAGVYVVQLAVTDDCGVTSTAREVGGMDAIVVIYDPNAGFVAGGGWIDSPAGAYTADPLLSGTANFGFVSKYKKGASNPTGETEFQFGVGNLNFHSTTYDWLVVSGAKAQYKGSGTINGAGTFQFILTAIDGQLSGGGGQDKFRMKISQTNGALVYDNMLGASDASDPATVLGGGSIVIQTAGKPGQASLMPETSSSLPVEFGISQIRPNPFDQSGVITFGLPERSRIQLVVFDLAGRSARMLADGEWETGVYSATMTRVGEDGSKLPGGIYFVRLNARSLAGGQSFTSLQKLVIVD